MGLYEFFFPHESIASSLHQINRDQPKLMRQQIKKVKIMSSKAAQNQKRISSTNKRISELEKDLGFLALLLSSIMLKLDQDNVLHKEELKEIMKEIDGFDGEVDGKLDINVLRGQTH